MSMKHKENLSLLFYDHTGDNFKMSSSLTCKIFSYNARKGNGCRQVVKERIEQFSYMTVSVNCSANTKV